MWSLGKVLNTPEVMRVYIGSVYSLSIISCEFYVQKKTIFKACSLHSVVFFPRHRHPCC